MIDSKALAEGALSKLPGAEAPAEESVESDPLDMAAEDVMTAFKSGSSDSLKSALMSFMDLYQAPPALPGLDE